MRLIFVRHGEPDYQKDCLTETGKIQAQLCAERLRSEGIEEIWSSPLGRAYETAEETAKVLGIPVQVLDCMKELQWGSKNDEDLYAGGHPWDIVDRMAREGTDLNRNDWRESPYFRSNRVTDCADAVSAGIDQWLAGFGYVRDGYYYQHRKTEEQHRTIALFCHGGSSSAAIGHILNLPFPYVCALLHMDFTGITILRFERKNGMGVLPCLELGSDSRHIGQ